MRQQNVDLPSTKIDAESAPDFIARQRRDLVARPVVADDIGREGRCIWVREALTLRQQDGDPHKVLLVERLRLSRVEGIRRRDKTQVGAVQFRFGYYTVSRRGKWAWWQFAPFIPEADLGPLLELARAEGTIADEA